MSRLVLRFCMAAALLTALPPLLAAESVVSAGFTVRGGDGKPLPGVKVFLYDSQQVRRPADFISSPTAADGRAVIMLPPGKYWAVARLKQDGTYGPLMPGDKHSGEPQELEILPAGGSETDFVVMDIREAGRKKRTESTGTRVVTGRVTTPSGTPVPMVWVFGHRTKKVAGMPEYVSAWTDIDGRYKLHVAVSDQVFIGVARSFPPVGELLPVAVSGQGSDRVDITVERE